MCTNYVKGDRYEVEWLLYSSWARNQASCVLGFSNEPLKGECQFINKFIIKLSSELILPPL